MSINVRIWAIVGWFAASLSVVLIVMFSQAMVVQANPPDVTPPTIIVNVRHNVPVNRTLIQISSEDADINAETWRYFLTQTDPGSCQTRPAGDYTETPRKVLQRQVVNVPHQDRQVKLYLCFRVKDSSNNPGYAKLVLPSLTDNFPPRIVVSVSRNTVTASSPDRDVNNNTWEYFAVETDSACIRGAARDVIPEYRSGRTVIFTQEQRRSRTKLFICFSVRDRAGNSGYARWSGTAPSDAPAPPSGSPLDTTPPSITVVVSGSTVTASSPDADVDNNTWRHYVSTVCSSCKGAVNYNRLGRSVTLTTQQRRLKQSVYFKVADNSGNVGHSDVVTVEAASAVVIETGVNIDVTAPTIKTARFGNMITASSPDRDVDNSTWRNYTTTINPDCRLVSNTSYSGRLSRVILTAAQRQVRQYICFRVADKAGNFGYAERMVNTLESSNGTGNSPPLEPEEDSVVIEITSSQDRLGYLDFTASVSDGSTNIDANSWRFVRDLSDPGACRQEAFSNLSAVGVADNQTIELSETDYGRYVCLKVSTMSEAHTAVKPVYIIEKSVSNDASPAKPKPSPPTPVATTNHSGTPAETTVASGLTLLDYLLLALIAIIILFIIILLIVRRRKKKKDELQRDRPPI